MKYFPRGELLFGNQNLIEILGLSAQQFSNEGKCSSKSEDVVQSSGSPFNGGLTRNLMSSDNSPGPL